MTDETGSPGRKSSSGRSYRDTRSVALESPRWHWKQICMRSARGSRFGLTMAGSPSPVGRAPFAHFSTWSAPGPWQRSQSIPCGYGSA